MTNQVPETSNNDSSESADFDTLLKRQLDALNDQEKQLGSCSHIASRAAKVFELQKTRFFKGVRENVKGINPTAIVVNNPPDYYLHNKENRLGLMLKNLERLESIFKGS